MASIVLQKIEKYSPETVLKASIF